MPADTATATAPETKESTATAVADPKNAGDEALKALMAEPGDKPADAQRDDQGRFKAKDKPTELEAAADPAAVTLPAEQTGETPGAGDAPSDEDIRTAMAAIKRDGHADPDEWLKRNPEQFVAYGQQAAKRQADVSSYSDQLHKAERELVELKKRTTDVTTKTGDAAQPASGEQLPGIDEVTQPMVKAFEDLYGEDIAAPLKDSFNRLANLLRSSFDNQIAELHSDIRDAQLQDARSRLQKKWPGISDSENWSNVLKHLTVIEKNADVTGTLHDKVNYAAQVQFAPEMAKEAAKVLKGQHAARDLGSVETGTAPKQAGEKSYAELSSASLKARMDGKHDDAKKLDQEMKRRRAAA